LALKFPIAPTAFPATISTARAVTYLAGLDQVKEQIAAGLLVGQAVPYVTNMLTIIVPKGNPGHITRLTDLARPELRLIMPNPAFEGVARQIKQALVKAGGADLVRAVYEAKVGAGTTVPARIHHRQTPLFLMEGNAAAGVTWQSEAVFQEQVGHPINHIEIPVPQNATGVYAAAETANAPHHLAAQMWLSFIRSPEALAIFKRYGFKAYQASSNAN
jgi:ABC-type molybdate transport system substrate-binding protein